MGTVTLEFRNIIDDFAYTSIVSYPHVEHVVISNSYITISQVLGYCKYQNIQVTLKDVFSIKSTGIVFFILRMV